MLSKPRNANGAVRDRDVDARLMATVDRLEEDVVLGILHPRERLVEDELCARFGLKRHVTRRVLRELERRGLVEHRKNIGALVKSYAPQEVIELYAVRETLETSAARLIRLPVAPERLAPVVAAQERHDAAAAREDLRGVFRANLEFHSALFALSDNRVLHEAIQEYERRTQGIRFSSIASPDYLERVRAEHHRMIATLRTRDRRLLVALCRQHLHPSRDAWLRIHQRQFDVPPAGG